MYWLVLLAAFPTSKTIQPNSHTTIWLALLPVLVRCMTSQSNKVLTNLKFIVWSATLVMII